MNSLRMLNLDLLDLLEKMTVDTLITKYKGYVGRILIGI